MGPSIPKYPYNPSASQQVHGERNGAPEHMQHIQRQPPQIPPAAAAAQVSVARKPQQREQQFSGGGGVATTVGAARPSTTTEIISPSTNGVEGSAPFVEDGLGSQEICAVLRGPNPLVRDAATEYDSTTRDEHFTFEKLHRDEVGEQAAKARRHQSGGGGGHGPESSGCFVTRFRNR
ncbi:MAG: hypothetical protein BJ554DRAFT_6402 [Olpidium bornovanus]|uniref:Uncharacterized protein n=1 Tax=Olpidium bornovanus TaxID=278681 RepID=A0A8H7ZY11_9FUNG|nr:MAG: hypothetical protein BJ554DRAFT_6402 [Olpidium bornovanus]